LKQTYIETPKINPNPLDYHKHLHRHLSEYFSKTENPFALLAIAHDKLNRIDTTSHTIIYTDASKSDKGKTGISIYINPKENWHFRLSDNI
jgi:hypothetical protein